MVEVIPPAKFIFVAGQGGENSEGVNSPEFGDQVEQAFQNMVTALKAAGAGVEHVVKLTTLIVDHSEERFGLYYNIFNKVWGDLPKPACTLIPVPRLALKDMLFEIEATAVLPFE